MHSLTQRLKAKHLSGSFTLTLSQKIKYNEEASNSLLKPASSILVNVNESRLLALDSSGIPDKKEISVKDSSEDGSDGLRVQRR